MTGAELMAIGQVAQIGNAGMQHGLNQFNAKQQFGRQKELMHQQMMNQRQLNQQGHNLQYEMWKKTNFAEQRKQLEKAGLNPALLYGNTGAQGTTGSQSGGSAGGGMAQMSQSAQFMGMESMLMAKQMEKMDAEILKLKEEAGYIGGAQTDLTWSQSDYYKDLGLKTQQETELVKLQQSLTRANTKEVGEKIKNWIIENDIKGEAKESIIKNYEMQAILTEVQGKLAEANITLTEAQEKKVKQDISESIQKVQSMRGELKVLQESKGTEGWEKKVAEKKNEIAGAYNDLVDKLGEANITQGYVKIGADSILKIADMVTDIFKPIKGLTKLFKRDSRGNVVEEQQIPTK
jgi:hypothetical protein